MANDDNEIIKLSCDTCEKNKQGTFKELFGKLLSLVLLPKLLCTCGGTICVGFTDTYK